MVAGRRGRRTGKGSGPTCGGGRLLLEADRIGRDGLGPNPSPPGALLAEERRLFYVAATRARDRLVVTAVKASAGGRRGPALPLPHRTRRGRRPTSRAGRSDRSRWPDWSSELRRTVADPDDQRGAARTQPRAGSRGSRRRRVGQRQLVPTADPATWWGTRSLSLSARPVRDPDQPVPVSASVLESVMVCPAQWFLRDEAGGIERAHQEANLGQLLHALAERVASGELTSGPGTSTSSMGHVDAVWDRLHFRTPWSKAREYDRVRPRPDPLPGLALLRQARAGRHRGAVRHGRRAARRGAGAAHRLRRPARARRRRQRRGRRPQDRAQRAVQQVGRDVTGSSALYQYAVDSGALDAGLGSGTELRSGGAELVQLGALDDGPGRRAAAAGHARGRARARTGCARRSA